MDQSLRDGEPGVLDIDDLLGRCLGNLQFAEHVLTMFQTRCDEDLAELEQAATSGDADQVARLAHRLKGASANAAAPRLRAQAEQIEMAAREQNLADLPDRLDELRQEWRSFAAAARAAVSSESGA